MLDAAFVHATPKKCPVKMQITSRANKAPEPCQIPSSKCDQLPNHFLVPGPLATALQLSGVREEVAAGARASRPESFLLVSKEGMER